MWFENLKELKKRANKSTKEIIEGTMLPERTVTRIFSGETEHPTITTLIPIVNFLGGSLDEVFADTKAVVGDRNLVVLQEKIDMITAELDLIKAENAILKSENELLNIKLAHKDEVIALHNIIINLSKLNKE